MYIVKCTIYNVQQGVQKISKIVINGSILITRFAVERLDKNKHFKKKRKKSKKVGVEEEIF